MATKQKPLRLEYLDPAELEGNAHNWRTHPDSQATALEDVIGEVGWAGALLYNERTKRLVDGHLRKERFAGQKVPVLVGSWTPAQEKKILATLDPLGAMAEANSEALQKLLANVETGSDALRCMLEDLAKRLGIGPALRRRHPRAPLRHGPGTETCKLAPLKRNGWQTKIHR